MSEKIIGDASGVSSNVESMLFQSEGISPRFAVGLHLYFDVALKAKRVKVRANLVGWYPPYVLMTTTPLVDERVLALSTGAEMVVRYLFQGQIFGFFTRLVRKMSDPAPMWLLEYPSIVEVKNLRNNPRVQTFMPAKFAGGDEVLILDCSTNGALIAVDSDREIGESVSLTFTLPDSVEITQLNARVVRVHATELDRTIGVVFDPAASEQIQHIRSYIDQCVRYNRGGTTEFPFRE